jgi:hypothetical protein
MRENHLLVTEMRPSVKNGAGATRVHRGGEQSYYSPYSQMSIPLLLQEEIHLVTYFTFQEEKGYPHLVLLVVLVAVSGGAAPKEVI